MEQSGFDLDVRLVGTDALPEGVDGHSGLLVLGRSEYERPGLDQVRALLRAALGAEHPTLAIGAGCQQLALAAGGRVGVNPDGPEFGASLIAKRTAAARDPLFAELPITPDVIQWHSNTVLVLPGSAVLLASAPACENQAFRIGRLAWGVQFHVEADPDVVSGWARADAAVRADYDVERILSRAAGVDDDVVEAWAPFASAFAEVVRDPSAVPPAHSGPPARAAHPVGDPAAIRAALAAEMTRSRGQSPLPMPGRRPPEDE